jgi:serine/threonine-protein kinase
MDSHPPTSLSSLPFSAWKRIDRVCEQFEAAWRAGGPEPRPEDYLAGVPEAERALLLRELLQLERELRQRRGQDVAAVSYRERFPEYSTLIEALLLPAAGAEAVCSPDSRTEILGAAAPVTTRPGPAEPLPDFRSAGYEVLEELGRGGMAVVYKARQAGLKRPVALKMILGAGRSQADRLLRFRVEGEVVARLRHPNIVQIYEVGTHAGYPYLALEYVDGGTLADRLDGTPYPPRQAAALVEILARAVHVAHQAGVVHRDLKPANILLQKVASSQQSVASRKEKADATDYWLLTTLPRSRTSASPSTCTPTCVSPRPATWSAPRTTWRPSSSGPTATRSRPPPTGMPSAYCSMSCSRAGCRSGKRT